MVTNRLVDRATAYEIDVSPEKSKVMTNSMNNIGADTSMNGQKLEEVISFKYLHRSSPMQGWHLLSRNPHQDCLRKRVKDVRHSATLPSCKNKTFLIIEHFN